MALFLGISFALIFNWEHSARIKNATKILLQVSVVGLGFGMNFSRLLAAGTHGFGYTAAGLAFAIGIGILLGRWLRVPEKTAYLISSGTAICGGSAIAAVGPIIGADSEEMSISLGTIFILNSVALLIFPLIGTALGLTQEEFGFWAALAIHDTSSVVGAASKYGAAALSLAATVKLARALWIIPLSLATAAFYKSKAVLSWPWFILFFIVAAALNTYLPLPGEIYGKLALGAKAGLKGTLFFIGSEISSATLKTVGPRPFLQGVILWAMISALSLTLILAGLIGN